jgi:hypothetical protein
LTKLVIFDQLLTNLTQLVIFYQLDQLKDTRSVCSQI